MQGMGQENSRYYEAGKENNGAESLNEIKNGRSG